MDTKKLSPKNKLTKVLLLSWSRCNWMTQFSIPIFPVTSNHVASSNCIGCCECSANSCAAIAWWKASCGFVISGWDQLTRATMKFEFTLGCIQNMKVKIKVDVLCIHRMEQLKGKLPLAVGNSHTHICRMSVNWRSEKLWSCVSSGFSRDHRFPKINLVSKRPWAVSPDKDVQKTVPHHHPNNLRMPW